MAVFHPHIVQCVCGNTLPVDLADSINISRAPEMRERVLRGELHRAACPACSRQFTVEKPFYYVDIPKNLIFKVCPRTERHMWKTFSEELDRASNFVPASLSQPADRALRVVCGMDELREKLVAQDAGLDDRLVELFKVLVVYEHPILLKRARLRLTLDAVDDNNLSFVAAYEHSAPRFRVQMPKAIASDLVQDPEVLQKWARDAHKNSVMNLPDHWVNMWRWSPQPSALDALKGYAAQLRGGENVNMASAEFQQMLNGLPRGSHLPSWAKQDLRTVFEYAKESSLQKLQDALFEIRFGFELEDDWSANKDLDDIDTLWNLLKDLPDTNVEGNTKIHELLLDVGSGGGTYDPSSCDIAIGSNELVTRERFEDVVRHEVGHAVHEMKDDIVNKWLQDNFGWEVFSRADGDIDQWVNLMGGWSGMSKGQIREARAALTLALGNGSSWKPGPTPSLPPGHPWYRADFGPRLAFEKTGANWYKNNGAWYRKNGKAFFLNYWYQTFFAVDIQTLDLVQKMPDSYASMSHYEFFAELYALYYDLDDPKRKVIPSDVMKWIDVNIGAPEVRAPMPMAPRARKDYEETIRPTSKE